MDTSARLSTRQRLEQFNREYEVNEYASGIILIGSDGGGEGFGFDRQSVAMFIVRVPFIGIGSSHPAVTMASQISEARKSNVSRSMVPPPMVFRSGTQFLLRSLRTLLP
jgi:hypothetical protein